MAQCRMARKQHAALSCPTLGGHALTYLLTRVRHKRMISVMSEMAHMVRVPALTLGWRLKMALGDMPVTTMADHLGVSRGRCPGG